MGIRLSTYSVIIAVVGTVVPVVLALLVWRFARRRDLVTPFVALNAAIAGWSLDVAFLGAVADSATAAVVDRLAQACILAIPWLWTVYAAAFVERPLPRRVRLLAAGWSGLLLVLAWTPLYFAGYRRHSFGYYGVAGPLYPLVALTFVAAYLTAAWYLANGVRNAGDPRLRNQRQYVLAASLFMGLLGFDNFLPIFGVVHRPFGNLAVLAYSGILALALARHRLMDFTVVFRRGLLYSASTALASFLYVAVTLVGSELSRRSGEPSGVLPLAAGFAVAAGAYPAFRWTERRCLRGTGGSMSDRRRALGEARARLQTAGDVGALESLFGEIIGAHFPGAEVEVRWGEHPQDMGVVVGDEGEIFPLPGGQGASWCVPLRSGSREAGVMVLRGGEGWSLEELDLAVELCGCFAVACRDLAHRSHVRGIEQFHHRILDCIDIGLVLIDGTGSIVAANSAGTMLLARLGQEDRGIGPALLAAKEPLTGRNGGEIRVRVTAIPSDRLTGLRVVALEDITEQRDLERRAKRAETVSALGRMGAMVAHEIRTPLSTIMGACTLLGAGGLGETETPEYIGIILDEVRRLERFVDNCLRATRDPQPVLDPRVLDPLVGEIVGACASSGELPVAVSLGAGDARARVDEDLLRVAIGNLVDNARKSYGAEPGVVEVRTGIVTGGGGRRVSLVVSDAGRGMAPGEVRQIFEPFWSGRPGGLGLGLMVVASAVAAMQGEISVESAAGRGSVFTVTLPLEEERGS